jgi:hypothetical protein
MAGVETLECHVQYRKDEAAHIARFATPNKPSRTPAASSIMAAKFMASARGRSTTRSRKIRSPKSMPSGRGPSLNNLAPDGGQAMASAGRFQALVPVGIWGNLHQRSNQPQKSLLLGAAPFSEEIPHFNMRQTSSRRSVGLMNDERTTVRRLPTKKPGVAVWAAIQFSPF